MDGHVPLTWPQKRDIIVAVDEMPEKSSRKLVNQNSALFPVYCVGEKMTLRGLISPPRSRSSPRDFRPHNNGAPNPPSRPNYMSPRRRPTTAEQQHTQTHRKPSATATRATKKSPPRIRPSPKPTAPIVPSRRPNPNDLHNQKKLDTKTTPKIGGAKPSSPRTQPQRLRNGVEPPRGPTPISKNTTPKPKPAIAIASASRSVSPAANSSPSSKHLPSPGSAQHHDMKNHSPYSGGTYTPLADPQLNNHLQRLSIDGESSYLVYNS